MQIPDNMTEEEVIATINKVANRLAGRFRFGYHDLDDMKQQARLEAWKGLAKYDGKRPLENFLWTHVRNRLFNFKRDKYERPDKPCLKCPIKAFISPDGCLAFDDKMECHLFAGWLKRNETKKSLMKPVELSDGEGRTHSPVDEEVVTNEIMGILEKNIPIDLRSDYLKLKYGMKIDKNRRLKLQEVVEQILEEHGLDVEETW